MNFSFCQLLLLTAAVYCLSEVAPEEKKGDSTTAYVPYEPQLGSCLTDIVHLICSLVNNKPTVVHKRKDELINNILGLPRILQDIGK